MIALLAFATKFLGFLKGFFNLDRVFLEFDNPNIIYGKLMKAGKNQEGNQRIVDAFNKLADAVGLSGQSAGWLRDDGNGHGVWNKMKELCGLQPSGYMGQFPISKLPDIISYTKDLVTHLGGNISGIGSGFFDAMVYYGGDTQLLMERGSGRTAIKFHKDLKSIKDKFMSLLGEDNADIAGGTPPPPPPGGPTDQEITDKCTELYNTLLKRNPSGADIAGAIAWVRANNATLTDYETMETALIKGSDEYKNLVKQAGFGGNIFGIILVIVILGAIVYMAFKGPKT